MVDPRSCNDEDARPMAEAFARLRRRPGWPHESAEPIPFDTHRFVERPTKEGRPTGRAEVLADEQVALRNSNLATREDVAKCATKEDFSILGRRITAVTQGVAVLKSDVRTLKWIVSGAGFGMVTLVPGVSSLVIEIFWTV